MLAVSTGRESILVDCGGDVLQRAMQAGIEVHSISGVIITHEHPDHVGGWPLLVEKLWLHGRTAPIHVYGPADALRQAQTIFGSFDTSRWEGVPEIVWHPVALEEKTEFLHVGSLRFVASPGDHGVKVIGIRIDNTETGASVCYSADTRPSQSIARLAHRCDLLIHEASGDSPVHSTARDAAEIAAASGSRRLVLVHLPPGMTDDDLAGARALFADTSLGEELAAYEF